ncbi:hypothetical protein [Streptomyces lavendofoliae]|uniref:hypothetical protein n=1 Tax=Streptomyces lavendofoliae TaxID=67314 RepID=UPI003D8D3481
MISPLDADPADPFHFLAERAEEVDRVAWAAGGEVGESLSDGGKDLSVVGTGVACCAVCQGGEAVGVAGTARARAIWKVWKTSTQPPGPDSSR